MGTVIQLKKQINNSYFQLKDSVDEKLVLVEEKIKSKLISDVNLVHEMIISCTRLTSLISFDFIFSSTKTNFSSTESFS